jgi:hypothetical protein
MSTRYNRQYYSTPHYTPDEISPTIFGEKLHALPRMTRARIRFAAPSRGHLGDSRNSGLSDGIDSAGASLRHEKTGMYEQSGFDSGKDRAIDARDTSKAPHERHR